ncbi:MAG: RimJ/RimL family protein N-acetyltransferase [Saprospiraceae bacterium]|jgi:RimJ/RimL family protein N-acetyltransferase
MILKTTCKSKNGHDIIIRPAESKDAESLLKLKLQYLRNTKTIPLFEDEYKNSIEEESALIDMLSKEKNSCLIVAEYEGQLIGNIDIKGNQRRKLIHTGMLGMGVAEKWQGLGIGSFLMREAIKWIDENEHLEIIWLEVYDSNYPGKILYGKMRFQECGRIKGFFKESGQLIDNITMVYHSRKSS